MCQVKTAIAPGPTAAVLLTLELAQSRSHNTTKMPLDHSKSHYVVAPTKTKTMSTVYNSNTEQHNQEQCRAVALANHALVEDDSCNCPRWTPFCICAFLAPLSFTGM